MVVLVGQKAKSSWPCAHMGFQLADLTKQLLLSFHIFPFLGEVVVLKCPAIL